MVFSKIVLFDTEFGRVWLQYEARLSQLRWNSLLATGLIDETSVGFG
jgi:hypothetical protein